MSSIVCPCCTIAEVDSFRESTPSYPDPSPARPYQPQPAIPTRVKAAMQPGIAIESPSACGDCVDTSSLPIVLGHCCILGSCVGSAYMGGQP
jgi:hypothetical protein